MGPGAAENVSGQLRLAREKAIATGVEQPLHIPNNTTYHIHDTSGIATTWTLPRGITFTSECVNRWFHMEPDGRRQESNILVVTNQRGDRDTVSVQLLGLVLTK